MPPPVAHILESTSIIQHAIYKEQVGKYYYPFISDTIGLVLHYSTYDRNGSERIRMKNKPIKVLFENTKVDLESPTLIWKDLVVGGILQINRSDTRRISIYISPTVIFGLPLIMQIEEGKT